MSKIYHPETVNTERQFLITPNDLFQKNCQKSYNALKNWDVYQCFFEMSFEQNSIPQALYYFSVIVNIDKSTSATSEVDFVPITQIQSAPPLCVSLQFPNVPPTSTCELSIQTSLAWCNNDQCTATQPTPFKAPIVGDQLWVIHQITNDYFKNWVLQLESIFLKSDSLKTSIKLSGVVSKPGPNAGSIMYLIPMKVVQKDV